jgi:NAD(P)-dependent dehydrogenase (short-subunit alcohol dehydrogenase family)
MSLAILWSKISAFLGMYLWGTYYSIKQALTWTTLGENDVQRPKLKTDHPLALLTGGTKGIGFELAQLLVKNDFNVLLVARNKIDGAAAMDELKKLNPKCNVEFHSVDLTKMNELKSFADKVKREHKKLNLLINNAALMMTEYKLVDGVELQWAANVVATVYLCDTMSGLLEKGAKEDNLGRIVNVSSSAMFGQNLTSDYIKSTPTSDNYSSHLAYCNSKFAIALYTELVQKRFVDANNSIIATCLHPGIITTGLYQHISPILKAFFNFPLTKKFLRSPKAAAMDMLYLCFTDPSKMSKGKYYENGLVVGLPYANDDVQSAFKEYVDKLRKSF